MRPVRSAILASLFGQYAGLLISLGSVITISRLLTPDEIGIFSVSMALTLLAGVLRQFGVGDYLIQKKELLPNDLRACFTISLAMSWSLAIALLLTRGLLADLYQTPALASVIAVISLNFFLTPFGVVASSLLRRDMKFGVLSFANIGSAAVGALVAISGAYLGASYMALAWGAVAGSVTSIAIITIVCPKQILYWPTRIGLSPILNFGSISAGAAIIAHMGIYAPDLILGGLMSMTAVALFSRAQTIIRAFQTGIHGALTPVAQSYLANSARHSKEIVRTDYLKVVTLITGIAWPFYGSMFIVTEELINVLFGDQWTASVQAAKLLCIGAMIYAPASFANSLFLALGDIKKNLIRDAILQPLRIAMIFFAATVSLEAVALAIVITHLIAVIIVHFQQRQILDLTAKEHLIRPLLSSLLVGLGTVATCFLAWNSLQFLSLASPILLGLTGLITGAAWLASLRLANHPMYNELSKLPGFTRLFGT